MAQTAVEWFHKKTWELKMLLEKQQISVGEYGVAYYDIFEEAKQMEEEQIVKAFNQPLLYSDHTAQEYYTQTYGSGLQNETN